MATNALISLTKNNKTYVKIIAGCEGQRAELVIRELMHSMLSDQNLSLQDIYNIALEKKLGCIDCLVVMSENDEIYKSKDEKLDIKYRETFNNPRFNPRTNKGNLGYFYIIPVY